MGGAIGQETVAWDRSGDLLCLWTDGLVDAEAPSGERFGESRLLERLTDFRELAPEEIVARVMAEVDGFSTAPSDDRTLLVLRC
jgi:sigma-B regulation protein RsbU (phosphoserine phosphatase)